MSSDWQIYFTIVIILFIISRILAYSIIQSKKNLLSSFNKTNQSSSNKTNQKNILKEYNDQLVHIVNEASKSVVEITNFEKLSSYNPMRLFRGDLRAKGYGAGFIIDSSGLILTNNHVVEKSNRIDVVLNDLRPFNAEVIGTVKVHIHMRQ